MISLRIRRSPFGLRPILLGLIIVTCIFTIFELREGTMAMSRKPPPNQFFVKGETTFVDSCTAMPAGSLCKINKTGTALDGVVLHIDPGTVMENRSIQISINSGCLKFPDGKVSNNPIIEILIENDVKLNHPIRISVPIPVEHVNRTITAYFIKDNGSLSPVVLTPPKQEEDNVNRFSLYTFHSGLFTWIAHDDN